MAAGKYVDQLHEHATGGVHTYMRCNARSNGDDSFPKPRQTATHSLSYLTSTTKLS